MQCVSHDNISLSLRVGIKKLLAMIEASLQVQGYKLTLVV